MASEDPEYFAQKLLEVGIRAVRFQAYILRRAWGVYYAVWALAFMAFVFLPAIVGTLLPRYAAQPYPYIVLYVLVSIGAYSAARHVFRRAYRTAALRGAIQGNRTRFTRSWVAAGAIWITLYIALAVSIGFLGLRLENLFFLLLLWVPYWIYVSQKNTFGKPPPEAYLAIISYVVADIISLTLGQANNFYYLDAAWVSASLVWGLCSLYALYHAPEMMLVDNP